MLSATELREVSPRAGRRAGRWVCCLVGCVCVAALASKTRQLRTTLSSQRGCETRASSRLTSKDAPVLVGKPARSGGRHEACAGVRGAVRLRARGGAWGGGHQLLVADPLIKQVSTVKASCESMTTAVVARPCAALLMPGPVRTAQMRGEHRHAAPRTAGNRRTADHVGAWAL